MQFYAVEHIPSGGFLEQPKRGANTGGSFTRSEVSKDKPPRLFPTKRGAEYALGQWLKGPIVRDEARMRAKAKAIATPGGLNLISSSFSETLWTHDPDRAATERIADEYRIVPIELHVLPQD